MRILHILLLVFSCLGCQKSAGAGGAAIPPPASSQPVAAAQAGGEAIQPIAAPSGSLAMEPGKRLGEVTLGMTREELAQRFPDRVVKGIEVVSMSPDKTMEHITVGGMYRVLMEDGHVKAVSVNLAEFRNIDFSGKTLNSGLSLEQMAEILPNCKGHLALGATGFTCAGSNVIRAGASKLPQANVSVGVFAITGALAEPKVVPKPAPAKPTECKPGHHKVASPANCPMDDVEVYQLRDGSWCWGSTPHTKDPKRGF